MDERKAWVYGLFDTENADRIRYVGRTWSLKGVRDRVYRHCWDAKNLNREIPSARWIRKIGAERVGYVVLEETTQSQADDRERHWIATFRARGAADLNVLDGGDGSDPGAFSGDKNPKAVLSWGRVRELRNRAQRQYVSTAETAREWGVTTSAVSKILRNQTWYDPGYDPGIRKTVRDANKGGATRDLVWRNLTDAQVENLRARYLEGAGIPELIRETGIPQTSITRALFERYGSDESREACVSARPPARKSNTSVSRNDKIRAVQRYRAGETQTDLAKEYGVSQAAISLWVRRDTIEGL